MQVNNSISMLTTQRAISSAGKELTEAMERLATGTKINNSADDPIGHSIGQRMTAQIRALNTAVKNANDGIAMTRSIEGAIGTLRRGASFVWVPPDPAFPAAWRAR